MSRLFIGNLPCDIREDELQEIFGKFGKIRDVCIKTSRSNPDLPAYCFLEYYDDRDADGAIRSRDGYDVDGRIIRVERQTGKGPKENRRDRYDDRGRDYDRRDYDRRDNNRDDRYGVRDRDYDRRDYDRRDYGRRDYDRQDRYRDDRYGNRDRDYDRRDDRYGRRDRDYPRRDYDRPRVNKRRRGIRLALTNLPPTGSWQDIKDHFRRFGDILHADFDSRNCTGILEFAEDSEAKDAIREMHNTTFKSHKGDTSEMRVEYESAPMNGSDSPSKRTRLRSNDEPRDEEEFKVDEDNREAFSKSVSRSPARSSRSGSPKSRSPSPRSEKSRSASRSPSRD